MNRVPLKLLVLVVLTALACAGCKKTVKGETNKWNASKAGLQKYSAKYSNLAEVIEEHLTKSQKAFDKAKKISDEEERVKAMAAANEAVRKVIRPFESYDLAVRETRKLIKNRQILKLPANRVNPALKACKKAKNRAYRKLSDAEVEDVDELIAKVSSAANTVKSGMSRLKALKREVDRAKKKEKKKKKKGKRDKKSK